jgi:hypothetical protein
VCVNLAAGPGAVRLGRVGEHLYDAPAVGAIRWRVPVAGNAAHKFRVEPYRLKFDHLKFALRDKPTQT